MPFAHSYFRLMAKYSIEDKLERRALNDMMRELTGDRTYATKEIAEQARLKLPKADQFYVAECIQL